MVGGNMGVSIYDYIYILKLPGDSIFKIGLCSPAVHETQSNPSKLQYPFFRQKFPDIIGVHISMYAEKISIIQVCNHVHRYYVPSMEDIIHIREVLAFDSAQFIRYTVEMGVR